MIKIRQRNAVTGPIGPAKTDLAKFRPVAGRLPGFQPGCAYFAPALSYARTITTHDKKEDHALYDAKILEDSIGENGCRLTTMEVTFPRIVLAEFNTHRMFSRNSASSRAIPVEKMLQRVREDPFVPLWWGKNQPGMQANEELTGDALAEAKASWTCARFNAIATVEALVKVGLHKQVANRLLEPFLWHTVIVTATEWENFFNLRAHKDAQPEIREIAVRMKALYATSVPKLLLQGEWHLPLVNDLDALAAQYDISMIKKVAVGRCARVSHLTHDGTRDPQADIVLADRLQSSGHMSPFEHVACPARNDDMHGNFRGWWQFRKSLPSEAVFPAP